MSASAPTGPFGPADYVAEDQPIDKGVMLAQALEDCGPNGGGGGGGFMPVAHMATVQVLFAKPDGMQIRYDMSGQGMFDSPPIFAPGRQTFGQAAVYRVKLTNIPGREGVELYPTITVAPITPRTHSYLAHAAIPIQFTEEDFDQVLTGNFVTKVVYLPDPEFQELAVSGVDTLVSNKLQPGVDPVVEADRRGTIMAVVRLGNKDLQLPSADGSFTGAGESMVDGGYVGGYPGGAMPPMARQDVGGDGMRLAANYISGVTAPNYGMPFTGTPIGLPGPPHIPLGGPAGLRRHVMRNRTNVRMPDPNDSLTIDVRQRPGYSYPSPPSHVRIREDNIHAGMSYRQPAAYRRQLLPSGSAPTSIMPGMTRRQARLQDECEIYP